MNNEKHYKEAQGLVDVTVSPLPCPFCGVTAIAVVEGSTFRWRQVECLGCGARCGETRAQTIPPIDPKKNELWAIEEWNKRAADKNCPPRTVEQAVAATLSTEVRRMRHRIECLRGALKSASGWLHSLDDNEHANDCLAMAGDMEPPLKGANVKLRGAIDRERPS